MGNKSGRRKRREGNGGGPPAFDPSAWPHGCAHYRRRCQVVAPCCGMQTWCRLCHDAVYEDGDGLAGCEAHKMDRHAVAEVVCCACQHRQPAAQQCSKCQQVLGRYFCAKCNLYDDDNTKGQFHCDKCGICRVGGRENMRHCDRCDSCVKASKPHNCLEGSVRADCSVCLEYMFDSREGVTMMRCGHSMHTKCLRGLIKAQRYKCPLCSKSIIQDLSEFNARMDAEVAVTPMPSSYAGHRREVFCNDCEKHCIRPFHVVGHKCAYCGGYNTQVVKELGPARPGEHDVDEYVPGRVVASEDGTGAGAGAGEAGAAGAGAGHGAAPAAAAAATTTGGAGRPTGTGNDETVAGAGSGAAGS